MGDPVTCQPSPDGTSVHVIPGSNEPCVPAGSAGGVGLVAAASLDAPAAAVSTETGVVVPGAALEAAAAGVLRVADESEVEVHAAIEVANAQQTPIIRQVLILFIGFAMVDEVASPCGATVSRPDRRQDAVGLYIRSERWTVQLNSSRNPSGSGRQRHSPASYYTRWSASCCCCPCRNSSSRVVPEPLTGVVFQTPSLTYATYTAASSVPMSMNLP